MSQAFFRGAMVPSRAIARKHWVKKKSRPARRPKWGSRARVRDRGKSRGKRDPVPLWPAALGAIHRDKSRISSWLIPRRPNRPIPATLRIVAEFDSRSWTWKENLFAAGTAARQAHFTDSLSPGLTARRDSQDEIRTRKDRATFRCGPFALAKARPPIALLLRCRVRSLPQEVHALQCLFPLPRPWAFRFRVWLGRWRPVVSRAVVRASRSREAHVGTCAGADRRASPLPSTARRRVEGRGALSRGQSARYLRTAGVSIASPCARQAR